MAIPNPTGPGNPTFESKHLHVRPEGVGPAEFHFTFEMQEKRIGNALGLSVGGHAAAVLLIFLIARMLPEKVYESVLPDRLPDIVWIAQPGPGGGGGGGGNKSPDPPKKVEIKGEKPISVPVKEEPKPEVKKEPEPEPEVKIPAETAAAAPVIAPGAIESTQASNSQGRGELNGGGSGRGTGIGDGEGSGLGRGSGGGTGGGTYRPGNGVTIPQLVREVKPSYTADAMRAKVQGTVWLECVVMPDGSVGKVDVIRSLDSTFGLDQEAIKAAKQWRFRPGTRFGEPVPVLITIELAFTLR
jgi:periplasmic protein TonB